MIWILYRAMTFNIKWLHEHKRFSVFCRSLVLKDDMLCTLMYLIYINSKSCLLPHGILHNISGAQCQSCLCSSIYRCSPVS